LVEKDFLQLFQDVTVILTYHTAPVNNAAHDARV